MVNKYLIEVGHLPWCEWGIIIQNIKSKISTAKLKFYTDDWNQQLLKVVDSSGNIFHTLKMIVPETCKVYPYPADIGDNNYDELLDIPESIQNLIK